jgi:hypothetical protein
MVLVIGWATGTWNRTAGANRTRTRRGGVWRRVVRARFRSSACAFGLSWFINGSHISRMACYVYITMRLLQSLYSFRHYLNEYNMRFITV